MRQIVSIVALAATLILAQAASATTASQKLRKSETVVAWYKANRWHLRPSYRFCADLKSPSASGRCWRHRENMRWHRARVQRLTPKPTLSHLAGWLCIHSKEGAWNDSGDPYWGGLQMGWWFMRTYGAGLLKAKGPASNWTPLEQMAAAEGGYQMNGQSDRWMRGQWPMTYPPCAHLF